MKPGLPWGVLERVSLGPVSDQRDRVLPDEGDDLHVVGRLLLQQVSLVLVLAPEDLRHEHADRLQREVEGLGNLRVEGVHELEGATHLVGGHDVLVVHVGPFGEESDDGDLSSLHVTSEAWLKKYYYLFCLFVSFELTIVEVYQVGWLSSANVMFNNGQKL